MKGLKTYFTFLNRNKLFTFVNLVGLSISLMFVLLIANMVTRQLTVDRNLKDADRIWVYSNEYYAGGHYRLGMLFQERYPEIEDWCAVNSYQRFVVEADNRQVNGNIAVVRKNFFRFFTLPLVSGNRGEVMRGDNDVVLSRSFALKLFGTTDCLGKVLRCSFNEQDYRVSGVMDDIDNSIFPSEWDVLVPFENMKYINDAADMDDPNMRNSGSCILFMRTVKHADLNDKAADVAAYLKTVFWPYRHGSLKEAHFIPIHDFYFSETESVMLLNQYSFKKVVIFLTVGILILLMAVFNYVSMSVAQTSYRAKEMATRRLLGSTRRDIFWRMILESVLLTAFAFMLGFLFAKAAEPYAMKLLGVRLDIVGSLSGLTPAGLHRDHPAAFVPVGILPGYPAFELQPHGCGEGHFPAQDQGAVSASAQYLPERSDHSHAGLLALSVRTAVPDTARAPGLRVRTDCGLSSAGRKIPAGFVPGRSPETAVCKAGEFLYGYSQ